MFVRARVNPWNVSLIDTVVKHYTERQIPVVLTMMAYYTETVPEEHSDSFKFAKRTLNSYWVPTEEAWDRVRDRYKDNKLVHMCGKDSSTHGCKYCGNCLREYFATKERWQAALAEERLREEARTGTTIPEWWPQGQSHK